MGGEGRSRGGEPMAVMHAWRTLRGRCDDMPETVLRVKGEAEGPPNPEPGGEGGQRDPWRCFVGYAHCFVGFTWRVLGRGWRWRIPGCNNRQLDNHGSDEEEVGDKHDGIRDGKAAAVVEGGSDATLFSTANGLDGPRKIRGCLRCEEGVFGSF
ncbi:hypothetical protein VTI74DRAFT_707 [Chaetomium olivicolor]